MQILKIYTIYYSVIFAMTLQKARLALALGHTIVKSPEQTYDAPEVLRIGAKNWRFGYLYLQAELKQNDSECGAKFWKSCHLSTENYKQKSWVTSVVYPENLSGGGQITKNLLEMKYTGLEFHHYEFH